MRAQALCVAPSAACLLTRVPCAVRSVGYCGLGTGEVGVFLLCEVALGNQYPCYGATYVEVLPRGKHSTLGCGRQVPSPSASIYTYPLPSAHAHAPPHTHTPHRTRTRTPSLRTRTRPTAHTRSWPTQIYMGAWVQ